MVTGVDADLLTSLWTNGFPASASQAREGCRTSQPGAVEKRLAASRSSARCGLADRSGNVSSRLPASISFSSRGRSASASGSAPTRLSVRISQRSAGGRAEPGTVSIWQPRKPIIESCPQAPSTSGSAVNGLPEPKITRSRCRRGSSSGSVRSRLSPRSSSSSVSASANTSSGSRSRPQPRRSSRRAPAWSPRRSAFRFGLIMFMNQFNSFKKCNLFTL